MMQLVWLLINLAAAIVFIIIGFRSIGMIRQKFGTVAAVIFLFGFIGFTCTPAKDATNDTSYKWASANSDKLEKIIKADRLVLYKNWINRLELAIYYGRSDSGIIQPEKARTTISGTSGGTKWTTEFLSLVYTESEIVYQVTGSLEWRLFNIPILTEYKSFGGSIPVKQMQAGKN